MFERGTERKEPDPRDSVADRLCLDPSTGQLIDDLPVPRKRQVFPLTSDGS